MGPKAPGNLLWYSFHFKLIFIYWQSNKWVTLVYFKLALKVLRVSGLTNWGLPNQCVSLPLTIVPVGAEEAEKFPHQSWNCHVRHHARSIAFLEEEREQRKQGKKRGRKTYLHGDMATGLLHERRQDIYVWPSLWRDTFELGCGSAVLGLISRMCWGEVFLSSWKATASLDGSSTF